MRIAGRLAAQARELGRATSRRASPRRAGPDRPRVPLRPRRLPLDARLQGLPEVAVHERQRGDLPRHPRQPRGRGRRHRQHRHHRLPRRRARRHQRHLPHPGRRQEVRDLVERTREALRRAINAVKPGRRINVIGRVIESYARAVRLRRRTRVHRPRHRLVVPLRPGRSRTSTTRTTTTVIEPGMTFTIEPMLNLGTHDWDMWDDDWTVVTKDRRAERPVRAHPAGHRRRRRDPDPPLTRRPETAARTGTRSR